MNDDLIRRYFQRQSEEVDDSFDTSAFLRMMEERNRQKPSRKEIFPSGMAVSLGMILLFALSLLMEPMKSGEAYRQWETNAEQNIQTIEMTISKRGEM